MAKEKAVGFTRKDAERILDTLSRVEGTPSSVIPPVDRSRTYTESPSLPFQNRSGETIPAFGCFRITRSQQYAVDVKLPLIWAVKPTTNRQGYDIGVNGAVPCKDGEVGQMQTTPTVKVLYGRAPNDETREDKLWPYNGLTVGATDDWSANVFGYDFICRGVAQSFATTEVFYYIIATPIPKTEPFQVHLECTNDTDENRGTAETKADLLYNVRYLKNFTTTVDPRIPILRARHSPDNSGSIFERPLLGRVKPATGGLAIWRPYASAGGGNQPRKLDLIYINEVSEFTTC